MSFKNLPSGYSRIGRWGARDLSALDVVKVLAIFAGLLYVSLIVAFVFTEGVSASGEVTTRTGPFLTWLIAGIVLGFALHELAHAAAFGLFGARPSFGFKPWTRFGPVFYVSAPGSYLSRREFVIAGLAPSPLLAALLLPVMVLSSEGSLVYTLAWWAFVAGVSGSAGDLIIVWKLRRNPAGSYFEDLGDGFAVFGPEGEREPR